MRLIFRPSARVRERWPSRVGFGSVGGLSAALAAPDFVFERELFVGAGTGFAAAFEAAGCLPAFAGCATAVLSAVLAAGFSGAAARTVVVSGIAGLEPPPGAACAVFTGWL